MGRRGPGGLRRRSSTAIDVGGSHLTYHQVFHRETSLTRWGGGLENYGASFTYFLYLWEQAGGNGGRHLHPRPPVRRRRRRPADQADLREPADGMEGVQAAIDAFNAQTGADLRIGRGPVQGLGDRGLPRRRGLRRAGTSRPSTSATRRSDGWTIDIANDEFWNGRGSTRARCPTPKWQHTQDVPPQTALPFGTSLRDVPQSGSERHA